MSSTTTPHLLSERGRSAALRRSPLGTLGLGMLALIVAVALFAPWIAPYDPYAPVRPRIDNIFAPPSPAHPLGTDDGGKDVLSALLYGARVSLLVGFTAAAGSVLLGGLVGLTAGYAGGRLGALLMALTNLFLVIPELPLAIVLVALLGANLWNIILAIVAVGWAGTARIVYAQVLALREREFVVAARAIGAREPYILRRHVAPLVLPLLLAQSALAIATAIVAEAGLAFLGLGDPSVISWGSTLNMAFNRGAVSAGAWWALLPPGLGIVWVVLGWTLLGFALEELINPRAGSHHLAPERRPR